MIISKRLSKVLSLLLFVLLVFDCSKGDSNQIPENLIPTGRSKVYEIFAVNGSGIFGTATFIENEGGFITANLNLENTTAGNMHPVFMHRFTAAEGGGVALELGTVDGSSGTSSMTFFKLNDGAKFGFDRLLQFDGYINIVLSESNKSQDISQGDIGINELNGNSVVYNMVNQIDEVIGTVTFKERINGTTFVIAGLENNPEAGDYPSHIHLGKFNDAGAIAISLQPLDGVAGFGQSQVNSLNNGLSITYDELIVFDGYVDIHQTSGGTVIAHANIMEN